MEETNSAHKAVTRQISRDPGLAGGSRVPTVWHPIKTGFGTLESPPESCLRGPGGFGPPAGPDMSSSRFKLQ
eukprot:gene11038-biopygen13898